MKKGLFIIVAIACIFCLTGCTEELKSLSDDIEKTAKVEDILKIEEDTVKTSKDSFAYYIEGYIKNTSDKDYSYVQVTYTTYDKDGNTLGTCLDNNGGLEANGRWKFKAMCLDEIKSIKSYKVTDIVGY